MRITPRVHRKLLDRADGVDIWRVDGHRVRDEIDVEFTNGHHHFTRRYIPPHEIWLDREAPGSGEWVFWAVHQLAQRWAMSRGADYLRALRIGNRAERDARRAAGEVVDGSRVRRRPLGSVDGRRIWLVDGHASRSAFDQDFTLGGHGLRYRFLPRDEVWIDDAVAPAERPAILHHELVEIRHMEAGMSYADAHARASRAERRFRREHPAQPRPRGSSGSGATRSSRGPSRGTSSPTSRSAASV
jgi:hypothetical protein